MCVFLYYQISDKNTIHDNYSRFTRLNAGQRALDRITVLGPTTSASQCELVTSHASLNSLTDVCKVFLRSTVHDKFQICFLFYCII